MTGLQLKRLRINQANLSGDIHPGMRDHWTQTELAEKLGVSLRTIQRWEMHEAKHIPKAYEKLIYAILYSPKDQPDLL